MGAFYGIRIKEGRLNPNTGKAWSISDVHPYWAEEVTTWLVKEMGGAS